MRKEFLEAGKVVGTHGVRGELRVEPWCDSAEFLTQFKTLYWEKGSVPVKVLGARVHKSLVLLRLEGVGSATQGDMLRGKILYLARKDAKLPEGRYFIQDLIGMQIQDAASTFRRNGPPQTEQTQQVRNRLPRRIARKKAK